MGLTVAQMSRMSALLDEALPLDAAGRHAWLERLAPEHQDLVTALRAALLPSAEQRADFKAILTLPRLAALDAIPGASGLKAGVRVGPYELIRLLGAGGMAEVWLARRADGAFKREVALKLPLRTHLRADLEPRFARERDILASLEHPRIARLYDAGVDPNALPYLSMEYVPGEPLTNWCEAQQLGVAARLGLFLQVLEAVQYAHSKHVLHRDLKPSNILVTSVDQVRLLDFGVSKLLGAEDTDEAPLTGVYGRAMTPDYASPELLLGQRIDERSDLYSLGVLLYELLTGARPYHLMRVASLGLLDEAIAHIKVPKPSAHTGTDPSLPSTGNPEQRARQLRGDLDAIVLKALAKDPDQRYQSAAEFAADLQRYLEHKPIRSQPAAPTYRLGKFLRRNGPVAGMAATALVVVLASMGYAAYRDHRAQIVVRAAAVASLADPVPATSEKSVAVLPFLDLSENRDQAYFSDGLAEELIDLLARVPDLKVPARTSSFYFKGKSEQIATIAEKLHVRYLLEGSVRKAGNTLRVTAQLIRADNGYHVWSDTYDRELKDIFKVQDEIAGAVVGALKVKLALGQPSPSHRTTNPEAYGEYLLGKQWLTRETFHGAAHANARFNVPSAWIRDTQMPMPTSHSSSSALPIRTASPAIGAGRQPTQKRRCRWDLTLLSPMRSAATSANTPGTGRARRRTLRAPSPSTRPMLKRAGFWASCSGR